MGLVYPDFYVERSYKGKDKKEKTLRIYESRDEINQLCIMDGSLPDKDNEIVIASMFADNNKTKTGEILSIDGKDYTVSGLVSFSDYTTMFQNNSDMMFDSVNFGVAMGTKSEFESLSDRNLTYNYAWTYNAGAPADDMEEKKSLKIFSLRGESFTEKVGV